MRGPRRRSTTRERNPAAAAAAAGPGPLCACGVRRWRERRPSIRGAASQWSALASWCPARSEFSEDYGKRKEKPGAFPLNPRLISSQSYRGLQNLPAPGLLPVAEPEKGPSMELEATPALHRPSPAVSEPASPPSAVAELEHMLPSSPCVPGAELQSAGPSAFPGIFTPALTIDIEPTVTPDGSCCVTPKNQLGEEKPDLLDFPSRLVTEQLTYMDTELFKKLLPHQCLDSVWSKRNKPGNEHLAPTVRATVAQFNGVAKCVITTCLGNPSMTARDRAMVVEHWIKVAKACQILQNYYSLNAIVSALQTVSIYHLKKTWEKVSR